MGTMYNTSISDEISHIYPATSNGTKFFRVLYCVPHHGFASDDSAQEPTSHQTPVTLLFPGALFLKMFKKSYSMCPDRRHHRP